MGNKKNKKEKALPDYKNPPPPPKQENPLKQQVGGNHYAKHAIQPIEIAYMYNLTPGATLALRYLLRYRDKNGAEDLQKMGHLASLIEEIEYNGRVDKIKALLKHIEDEENENSTPG